MQFFGRRGAVSLLNVKPPAVAGMFYPGDGAVLRRDVRAYLEAAEAHGPAPKAVIAPHAGYRYSGAVAASAYARLAAAATTVRRVLLLGPAHRVPVRGIAASSAQVFSTPLGDVEVDRPGLEQALAFPQVRRHDAAFAEEHSLEVHLPFLQECLPRFRVIPLLVGDAAPGEVAEVLDALWGGPETAVVISSDLSHYHDYDTARRMDAATSEAIVALDGDALGHDDACGRHAVKGLLVMARKHGLAAETVDLRNSGDTAGPKDRVVGYGAYVFVEPEPSGRLSFEERRRLLGLAANAIRRGLEGGKPPALDLAGQPEALHAVRASFVTLKLDGALRGCIGNLEAHRPLAEDVATNAAKAAFSDPRFAPVTAAEVDRLEISVSVLSPSSPIDCGSEQDLLAQLRPGVDGLILVDGARHATFLPSVWEGLPDPRAFVRQLKRKAGLTEDHWSSTIRAERYTTESFE